MSYDHEEMLLCARYNELDELKAMLDEYTKSTGNPARTALITVSPTSRNTALHYAAANGHLEIVDYVMGFLMPLDLNIQNAEGNTALHWAAYQGHMDVVKALLKGGADVNTLNLNGKSPMYDAELNGHHEIVSLLIQSFKEDQIEETEKDVKEENEQVEE